MEVLNQLAALFQGGECGGPNLEVILIDWSSASVGYSQQAPYVQSRFYRAPEVIFRQKYGPSVDIWSLGCVAAELFLGSPLFPGGDELDMLRLIQLKLGIMPDLMVKRMGDDSLAKHSDAWKLDKSMYSPGNFENFLKERAGREDFDFLAFVNILRQMLQLNCHARISASSAIGHPFVLGSQPMRTRQRKDSMMEDSTSGASSNHKRRRAVKKTNSRGARDPSSKETSSMCYEKDDE
jgi:serine/threonine protein kinase